MPIGMHLEAGAEPLQGYCLGIRRGMTAMTEVWEAVTSTNARVALKFTEPTRSSARDGRGHQLTREPRFSCLARVEWIGVYPEVIVQMMELADGSLGDLHTAYVRETGNGIPIESLYAYIFQAAEALDYLNSKQHVTEGGKRVGYQHNNIKPNNLLLFGSRLKLADCGRLSLMSETLTNITLEDSVAWVAPELLRGFVSDRSDQFSLALTYAYLRTGVYPFGEFPDERASAMNRKLPNLQALPAIERSIVQKALSPYPQDRWFSCGMFVRELGKALGAPAGGLALRDTKNDIPTSGTALALPRRK